MPQRTLASLAVALGATLLAAAPAQAASRPEPLAPDALFARVASSVVFIEVQRPDGADVGSGVVLHADGFVVTAAHVVEGSSSISVVFVDGHREPATVATLSRTEDLALLAVKALPPTTFVATLADSDELVVGQPVYCIGAPLGLRHTLTTGIVSAIRDNYGSELSLSPRHVIQTDASINQGTSGGALFDRFGRVVGIASFIASRSGGSVGLGFAVPSNIVRRRLFDEAIPYVGLVLRRVPAPLAAVLHWPYPESLLVEKVEAGSPAARAGFVGGVVPTDFAGFRVLMGGDLIVRVGPYGFDEPDKVHALLHGLGEGDHVAYTVLRAGKLVPVDLVLGPVIRVPALGRDRR